VILTHDSGAEDGGVVPRVFKCRIIKSTLRRRSELVIMTVAVQMTLRALLDDGWKKQRVRNL
jgi:hypothetical protein